MYVVHIRIILPNAADDILADAISGDPEARLLLDACIGLHRRITAITEPIKAASSNCCMICGSASFWQGHTPEAFVVVTRLDDDATPTTFGICGICYETHHTTEAIKDVVLDACRDRLGMPNLHLLPPVHATAGHA